MARYSIAKHWDQKRAERASVREAGHVEVTQCGKRIQVVAPFRERFRLGANGLGGTWRYRAQAWSFPARTREQTAGLVDLIETVYGAQWVPAWMRDEPKPEV